MIATALDLGLARLIVAVQSVQPTPEPTPTFDPDTITPGVTGFLVTAVFFVACGLLAWGLIRRVSRLSHRERVRAELEAERERADLGGAATGSASGGADADGAPSDAADGPVVDGPERPAD